jgi:ATP-dependent DNA ligase
LAIEGRVARFIEPMECMPVEKIPEGDVWSYELKLDGYRLVAVKTSGRVTLYSRRGIDLSKRFKYIVSALASLPEETVIDGEVVAIHAQLLHQAVLQSPHTGSRCSARRGRDRTASCLVRP